MPALITTLAASSDTRTGLEFQVIGDRTGRLSRDLTGTQWIVNRYVGEPAEITLRIAKKFGSGGMVAWVESTVEGQRPTRWRDAGDAWTSPGGFVVGTDVLVTLQTTAGVSHSAHIRLDDAGSGGGL